MRRIHFLILSLMLVALPFVVYAQSTTIDFEPGGSGSDWAWTMDQNGANPALVFPANPVSGGINTSATVAQFTATVGGQPWALCYTNDIEPFMFDATNSTIKIMVYKPVLSNVGIKLEGGSTPVEIQIANTVINQWQELTFDFSASIGNNYSRLVIIPDFAPRSQNNIIYFDNIQLPEGNIAPPAVPTVAAPIPTVDPADVISIYSDSYSNLPGTNFSPNWGQSTIVSTIDIDGNNMLKYAGFNYQGTQLSGNQDFSAMDYMHIDLWTENATVVKVTPISASTGEHLISLTPITSGSWNSYDIPLSAFIGLSMADIHQLKFDGQAGVSPSTIYLDNIYFYASSATGTDATLIDLKVNGLTLSGFSPAVISYNYAVISGMGIPTVTATTTDPNASLQIDNATEMPGTTRVVVIAEDGVTSLTYSIHFSEVEPEPTDTPPLPTHAATDVISIYSDAYDNVPGTNFNPFWDQNTVVTVDVDVAGNNTILYEGLDYQGTEFTSQDVSAFDYLHVDFWTANSTALSFFLISPGAETSYALDIVPGTWVSVDIPLSDYVPPVNLANVFQFKIVGNGDIWFDNFYFWKYPTAQGTDATLSDLQVEGSTIAGFAPLTETYIYGLLEGTVDAPQITSVSTTDPTATYFITQSPSVPGSATVLVTAQDGTTTKTYTVNFRIMYPNSLPPTPTHNAANVVSVFSDAYPDVVVDTWLTPWSQGTYEEVQILGNPVKKYTNLNFAGIETTGANLVDVSAMGYVHIDIWTPDANNFRFKLVDWGADSAWGGGDDTEHELEYIAPMTGQWISYDIPLSSFTNLNVTGNMAQYVLSKSPLGTMYIDNFYFYSMGPEIPSNVTIVRAGTQISISWDEVSGASSYTVYASDDPYGSFSPVSTGTYDGTSWSSGVSGSARFFYVTAHFDR